MERNEEPTLEKTGTKGNWLVITGVAGKYIARTLESREEVSRAHKACSTIKLEQAFEFTSQVQVGQVADPKNPARAMMQVGKMNLVYPLDATLFPVKGDMSLQGAFVYWCDDLTESDAPEYKDLIQGALRMASGWHQERVKNNTGVEVATAIPRGAPLPGMPHGVR